MEEIQVRHATLDEIRWIVDLSARVQNALTASGSLQQIGPLPLESTEESIRAGNAYILEIGQRRIGSTLIDPLDDFRLVKWRLLTLSKPLWYLHSLMLEPEEQGKGFGLAFLNGVKRLAALLAGTIVLDCWVGNTKLRDFYLRAGFTFYGVFPENNTSVAVFFFPMTASL